MRVNSDYLLVAETDEDPHVFLMHTERTSRLAGKPAGVVWHWTAGDYGPDIGHGDSEALCRSIEKRPPASALGGSWHFLIDRDGSVFQCAPLNVGTWHVGAPGVIAGRPVHNINRCTVGIELENAGRLKESGGRYYAWPYWRRGPGGGLDSRLGPNPHFEVPRERVMRIARPTADGIVAGGLFDAFDARQVASAECVLRALVPYFGWTQDVCAYGHYQFAYKSIGKEDPAAWLTLHLPGILSRVFGAVQPTPRPA